MSLAAHHSDDQEVPPTFMQRLVDKLAMSRFFTVSLLIHIILLILIGGTVMYSVSPPPTDFEAGNGGLMNDVNDAQPPTPEQQPDPNQVFTPTTPTVTAPALSAIASTATSNTAFTVAAPPDNAIKGISSDNGAQMASLAKSIGEKAGQGMAGKMGGTMKSGMIFGKKVEATKLGVILDVSGSAHKFLADAIKEIEKTFGDAVIILYPGCGLDEAKGKRPHTIRKFSTIKKDDLPDSAKGMTTAGQLVQAFKTSPELEKITKRPSSSDRLYVSWFDGDGGTGHAGLVGHTAVAFDDLIKNMKCDTIYWFSDFEDAESPAVAEDLLKECKAKKVKVYLHNFASQKMPAPAKSLAEGTGGTISLAEKK